VSRQRTTAGCRSWLPQLAAAAGCHRWLPQLAATAGCHSWLPQLAATACPLLLAPPQQTLAV